MKILVTGGAGFIGSNLCVELSKDRNEVTCFDNLSRRGSEILLKRVLEHNCKYVHGDIRNAEDFNKLDSEYDVMIECSAEPSALVGTAGKDAFYVINVNLLGSVNCFEFCRSHKIAVIFLSTSRVYPYNVINSLKYKESHSRFLYQGNKVGISRSGIKKTFPLEGFRSLYGASKLSAEYILKEYSNNFNIPSIINRCGVIAGPWQLGKVDQGVFTYWLVSHYLKKRIKYIGFGGNGKQVRDLLHIEDLVNLIKKQIKVIGNYRGEIFNVGGSLNSNLSLIEATNICQEITGNEIQIESDPETRPADVIWYITDNGDMLDAFNWRPNKSAFQILNDTFIWLRENEKHFISIFRS